RPTPLGESQLNLLIGGCFGYPEYVIILKIAMPSPVPPPLDAPMRGDHDPFLQEDFREFPFQSQRMLVELQTSTFRDTSAVEFWERLTQGHDTVENAMHLPAALAYAVETIQQLEEIATYMTCTQQQQNQPSRSILSLLKAHFRAILFHDASQTQVGSHPIEYVETLKLHTFQAFGSLRIHELFDIVRDYPDSGSLPAIEDLRKCLEVTRQQPELLATFQNAIKTRVLQPGASTTSIIGVYTRAIKVPLKAPIAFNKSPFQPTWGCLSGELYEELERDRRVEPVIDSDDDDVCDAELWQPEPADTIAVSRGRQVDDLLSSLVSIYANQTVFVNEYRMMLAERLLSAKDFNTDRDVHTLELLKLRFGDARLQQCDIMIKDVDESKRIHANLGLAVDATVVSEHFWPPFQGDDFTLHPRLSDMIRQYKEAYAVLKNPRQLDWVPYLGFVENEHLTLNHAYSPSEAVESSQPGSDTFLEPSVSSKRQADADIKVRAIIRPASSS
ncbi:hypothetical protein DYB32_010055, partial [Aphanomyces invadans]